jgi:hypothetical protein
VNPDASRSCAGPGSAGCAQRVRTDLCGCVGNVGPPRAGPSTELAGHTRAGSKSARGRRSSRSAPGSGTAHTGKTDTMRPLNQRKPRSALDGCQSWRDTSPASCSTRWRSTVPVKNLAVMSRRRASSWRLPRKLLQLRPLASPEIQAGARLLRRWLRPVATGAAPPAVAPPHHLKKSAE